MWVCWLPVPLPFSATCGLCSPHVIQKMEVLLYSPSLYESWSKLELSEFTRKEKITSETCQVCCNGMRFQGNPTMVESMFPGIDAGSSRHGCFVVRRFGESFGLFAEYIFCCNEMKRNEVQWSELLFIISEHHYCHRSTLPGWDFPNQMFCKKMQLFLTLTFSRKAVKHGL